MEGYDMGPIAALDSVFTKYFRISGRASRSEFWWYSLAQVLIMLVAIFVDIALYDPETVTTINPFAIMMLTTAWFLLTIVPNFTVAVRRLHDTGRSGFWMLISWIPFVGPLFYLVFLMMPSTPDDNIYGQPPRGGGRMSRGAGYGGSSSSAASTNPMAGYALLNKTERPKTSAEIAAQKAEIRDYYRAHVLGQST